MSLVTESKTELEQQIILEQWKTCVETANGITEKRNTANNIYITINTALLAVITFNTDFKSAILSLTGIGICILWFITLNSYKHLNSVKFQIINELEELLPTSPFKDEWQIIKTQTKYINLTKTEKVVPILFAIVYFGCLLYPYSKVLLKILCNCTGG